MRGEARLTNTCNKIISVHVANHDKGLFKGEGMNKRTKSALIAFVVLTIAFIVVFSFDYTDTYVSGRFNKALDTHSYETGESFSLDAFLEYYDWDKVCVVLPETEQEFTDILGRTFVPKSHRDNSLWSLVLIKGGRVNAEIPISRDRLEHPADLNGICFDRWSAIIHFRENDSDTKAQEKLFFTSN